VLGSANYLCYVPSSLSSPAFAALLFSLCLAFPCLAVIKSCALVLCTPEPTRPQWREQLSVAGEYDPKIDPKRRPANLKDPGKECGYLEDPMEQDKVACKLCNKRIAG